MKIYKSTIKTDYLEFRLIVIAEIEEKAIKKINEYMNNHKAVHNNDFKIESLKEIEQNEGIISFNIYDNEDVLLNNI